MALGIQITPRCCAGMLMEIEIPWLNGVVTGICFTIGQPAEPAIIDDRSDAGTTGTGSERLCATRLT